MSKNVIAGELPPAAVRRDDEPPVLGEGGDQVQPPAAQPLLRHQHPHLLIQSQSHIQPEYTWLLLCPSPCPHTSFKTDWLKWSKNINTIRPCLDQ